MTNIPSFEKRSLYVFLFLIFGTILTHILYSDHSMLTGLTVLVWVLFSFMRIGVIAQSSAGYIGKVFSLPAKILHQASQKEKEIYDVVIIRFFQKDMVFFLVGIFIFFLWSLTNHFFPVEASAVSNLRDSQQNILQQSLSFQQNVYAFLIHVLPQAILVMIFLIAFSFSHSRDFLKIFMVTLLPAIVIFSLAVVMSSPMVSKFLWPDITMLKGLGWSDLSLFMRISDSYTDASSSPFIMRYIALGAVGAFGIYILFLPLVYLAFKSGKETLRLSMILSILAVLVAMDLFWQPSSLHFVALVPAFAMLGYLQGSAVQVIMKWSLDKRTKTEHII